MLKNTNYCYPHLWNTKNFQIYLTKYYKIMKTLIQSYQIMELRFKENKFVNEEYSFQHFLSELQIILRYLRKSEANTIVL